VGVEKRCWFCRNGIRHRDGSVTCIPLSRLEKRVVDVPKGTVAVNCEAFELRPRGYKLSKNFRLFF
jgi:hypothetical protein